MRTIVLSLGVAALFTPFAAHAQTAAENFSYKAPSGMFSEGTTKWQTYQLMHADAERRARLQSGDSVGATGSLSSSSSNAQSYPRPGESTAGARRRTAR